MRANTAEKTKMASILEQYESELKSSGNIPSNRQILSDEPVCLTLVINIFICNSISDIMRSCRSKLIYLIIANLFLSDKIFDFRLQLAMWISQMMHRCFVGKKKISGNHERFAVDNVFMFALEWW